MGQVLCDEFVLLAAVVEFRLQMIEGGAEWGMSGRAGGHDFSQFWAEESGVCPGEERSDA